MEITSESVFQAAEALAKKLKLTRADNLLETLGSLEDGHHILLVESHEIRTGPIVVEVFTGVATRTTVKDLHGDEIYRHAMPLSESYQAFEEPASANVPSNSVLYY